MNLISVIVPVYKAEGYLDKCIESIVNQIYQNLEIILIDDGSPDKSGEICDSWAKKDNRIEVFHTSNNGGGVARNIGLDHAKGDYIAFVDSDDYISPFMMGTLINQFSDEIDIVECEYVEVFNDDEIFNNKEENSIEIYDTNRAMEEHIKDHLFKQLIWNKLYKRQVVGDVRFIPGKKIDDEFFTYRIIGNARKLVHIKKVMYAYRQQEESVMHSMTLEKRIQAIEAKSKRHEYICERFPDLKEQSFLDLMYLCIYHGQKVIDNRNDYKIFSNSVDKLLFENNKDNIQHYRLRVKDLIWIIMAKISFAMTCKIRNRLRIGY